MWKKPDSGSSKKRNIRNNATPKVRQGTSTPNKDESVLQSCSHMNLDISEITSKPSAVRQTQQLTMSNASHGGPGSFYGAAPKTKKTPLLTELDIAYNDYLTAVAHQRKQMEIKKDNKIQIETQLSTLSKRLTVDQLMLEKTKRKLNDINFRTEVEKALQTVKIGFIDTLGHMEGDTAKNVRATSTAMAARLEHLETKDAYSGVDELRKVLQESNTILDKLRDSNSTDYLSKVVNATSQLENITESAQTIDSKLQCVAEKLPTLQSLAIERHARRSYEADQDQ